MLGLAALLLMGWCVGVGLLTLHTYMTLRRPPRRTYASAVARALPGEPGELPAGPGGPRNFDSWTFAWNRLELPVWEIPGDAPAGPVLVVTHGWGESRVTGLGRARWLLPLASRIILWDCPAHGTAPGLSRLGAIEHEALLALLDRVRHREGPLVLFGWSMGAGVSIHAGVTDSGVAGVIAEAPYRLAATPPLRMLRNLRLPVRPNLPIAMWLLDRACGGACEPRRFDRAMLASKLGAPLLVIHGGLDELCPIDDGRAIAQASPRGHLIEVEGCGHTGLWAHEPRAARLAGEVALWLRREGIVLQVPTVPP